MTVPPPDERAGRLLVVGAARSRLLDTLRALLLVAAIVLGVAAVARDRSGFVAALGSIGWRRTSLALVLTLLGLLASAETWRHAVESLAGTLDRNVARRAFFVTQLGKYLPGGVWTLIGQVDVARRQGLSPTRVGVGALLFVGYYVTTGALLAAGTLWWVSPELVAPYRPLVAAVLVGSVLVLTPQVLRRLLEVFARLSRLPLGPLELTAREVTPAIAWLAVTWTGYGLAATVLVGPLAPGEPFFEVALTATGAFAFAFAAGVLALPLPAGAGVREVALVLVLAPLVGVVPATSIAIVLRVLHTVGDLALAAGWALLGRRGPRRIEDDPTGTLPAG